MLNTGHRLAVSRQRCARLEMAEKALDWLVMTNTLSVP